MMSFGSKGQATFSRKKIFTILSYLEMISSSRFFSILQLAICLPFQWLTGKTHVLAHRKWGVRSMGHAVDMIHSVCKYIIDNVTLIHNDLYMLHIFDELRDELPEFKALLEYEFQNKKSAYVEESKENAVPLKEIVKELLSPENLDNQDSTDTLEKIAAIGIAALVVEMKDEKKPPTSTSPSLAQSSLMSTALKTSRSQC